MPVIDGGNVITDPIPDDIGQLPGAILTARCQYDFAADAGAQGAITLFSAAKIPDNAAILGGYVRVITALTSGGAATVALHVEAADDLIAAIVISGEPWLTTGGKDIIPDFTGTAVVKTTAARNVSATIGAADLTAGKFDVFLFYILEG